MRTVKGKNGPHRIGTMAITKSEGGTVGRC